MEITLKQLIAMILLLTIFNYGFWFSISLDDLKTGIVAASIMEVIGLLMAMACGYI